MGDGSLSGLFKEVTMKNVNFGLFLVLVGVLVTAQSLQGGFWNSVGKFFGDIVRDPRTVCIETCQAQNKNKPTVYERNYYYYDVNDYKPCRCKPKQASDYAEDLAHLVLTPSKKKKQSAQVK